MENIKSDIRMNDLIHLKTRTETVIKGISKQLLVHVTKSFCYCFQECIDSNGAHLQNIVFKT